MKTLTSLSHRLLKVLPFSGAAHSAHHIDAAGITETIQRALASAGINTKSAPLSGVAKTINDALSAAGLNQFASEHGTTPESRSRVARAPQVIEGEPSERVAHPEPAVGGKFLSRSYSNQAGTRTYKLYIPHSYSPEVLNEVPLVVMLHGCKQSPDDFAAGTRMNALAEQHGFLVVYPAQAANANGSKCWNWFRSQDQGRDGGEPSIIAGITREVASQYRIDERRIFIAGLSAGAAMAVILGAMYPELYAAIGVHSGLPYASAHDVPSAFSAMQGGGGLAGAPPSFAQTVPTIVFHGDGDHTVAASNGAAIVAAAVALSERQGLRATTHEGVTPAGRSYSRTVFANAGDDAVVEHWILHGAGHAWSGGSRNGSFTDPSGPDASTEMMRFFYAQKRAGTA